MHSKDTLNSGIQPGTVIENRTAITLSTLSRWEKFKQIFSLFLTGAAAISGIGAHSALAHEPAPPAATALATEDDQSYTESSYERTLARIVRELYETTLEDTTLVGTKVQVTRGQLLEQSGNRQDVENFLTAFIDQLMVEGNIDSYRKKVFEENTDAESRRIINDSYQSGNLKELILQQEYKHFSPELVVRIALLIAETRSGMESSATRYNQSLNDNEVWKAVDAAEPLNHPQIGQTPARLFMTVLLERLEQGDRHFNPDALRIIDAIFRAITAEDFWSYLDGEPAKYAGNGLMARLNSQVFSFSFAKDGQKWAEMINSLYDWPTHEAQGSLE